MTTQELPKTRHPRRTRITDVSELPIDADRDQRIRESILRRARRSKIKIADVSSLAVCWEIFHQGPMEEEICRHVEIIQLHLIEEGYPWIDAVAAWHVAFSPLFPLINALRLTAKALASLFHAG